MRTRQFLGTAHAQEETTPSPCLQELIPYRRLRKGHETRQSTADHKKGLVRQQSGLAGRSQTPPWGRQTHAGSSFMGEKKAKGQVDRTFWAEEIARARKTPSIRMEVIPVDGWLDR